VKPEPTTRAAFTGFMAASLMVLEILGVGHPFTGLLGGALVVLLAAAYTETLRSMRTLRQVTVTRRAPEQGVEGAPVRVPLLVRGGSERIPVLVVEDVAPRRMRPRGRTWFRMPLEPGEERILAWEAAPAPGYHLLDEVVLAVSDPLGLFEAWTSRIVKSSMSVAPLALGEAEAGSGGLGRSEARWSRLTGHGLEFHHIREYVPGDDVRMVAWTATARTGRPMVRVGLREVELNLNIIVDLSGPSWVGTPGEAPADWIMRLALALAQAAARSAGTLTATLYQGEIWWTTPPLRGRDTVDVLRRTFSLQGPSRATLRMRIGSVIERAISTTPAGTLNVVLLGPGAPLGRVLEALSQRPGSIVTVVAPTGGSSVERLVRRVEREAVERYMEEYAGAGVRLLYAGSPGEVYSAYRVILDAAVRAGQGGR